MTGGEGADLFVFRDLAEGEADVITDFQDGIDTLCVFGGGLGDLAIDDADTGAVVTLDGVTIVVENLAAADLTVDDFLFT